MIGMGGGSISDVKPLHLFGSRSVSAAVPQADMAALRTVEFRGPFEVGYTKSHGVGDSSLRTNRPDSRSQVAIDQQNGVENFVQWNGSCARKQLTIQLQAVTAGSILKFRVRETSGLLSPA